ncbi:hypothetical protein CROQUDRAFT_97346 [Cronartium quercuum f. sp. fusiforme G11]|uniref:Uncharacterized protein n=1 Tax=Cronartium quercuum f. sp. fusiforme G11 TaxID=708437 RepID=A0A9P6NBI2_9BASI|nr:hypothetical protein CROQUDRAFT_97346 [Cronartium quercuum f. sp. fusiforme G11]
MFYTQLTGFYQQGCQPLLINNHSLHPHATSFPFVKFRLIEDVERPHLSW